MNFKRLCDPGHPPFQEILRVTLGLSLETRLPNLESGALGISIRLSTGLID